MWILNYKFLFLGLSVILLLGAVFAMLTRGFDIGIDFTGGSILEVTYTAERPDLAALEASLTEKFPGTKLQAAGEKGLIIRTKDLGEAEYSAMTALLSRDGASSLSEDKFSSVGPTIGKELRSKAWVAIFAVLTGIILFITFAFRKVSQPVQSWKYGLITLVALVHDIIIPAGLFSFLGKEVDSLFVVALLSILGISVHDKIVVFDRVRENLKLRLFNTFNETVGKSLEQTFARSVNTSLTTLLVLGALWFIGPESTRDFSMLLFTGVAIGTYSSIFFAAPLLAMVERWQNNKKKK